MLGRHLVENDEKRRTVSVEPHLEQGGGFAETCTNSSNRSSHASQRYA
jgi:hypothetical protein